MDLKEVLDKRVSTRSYSKEEVSKEDIDLLLEAAYKAPIANGLYDKCMLTVITNKEFINQIAKEYQEKADKSKDPFFDAPLLIIFSSKKESSAKYEDAGCIIENIILQATSLNLGSCYIRGAFNFLGKEADYIKNLNLDQGFYPVSGVVIGKTEKIQGKNHSIKTNFIN